jgi:hypothetical protein
VTNPIVIPTELKHPSPFHFPIIVSSVCKEDFGTQKLEHESQVELDDAIPPPTFSTSKSNAHCATVNPTKNVLRINFRGNSAPKSVHIMKPTRGRVLAIWYCERESGRNYISESLAKDCDLKIMSLSERDENFWVEKEDGQRETCFGKANLKWHTITKDGRNSAEIHIESQCFVCHYEPL